MVSLQSQRAVALALRPLLADPPDDRVGMVEAAYIGIAEAGLDDARRDLLAEFVNHYANLSEAERTRLVHRLSDNVDAEVRAMTEVFHVLGARDTARRSISRVVGARFGPLPKDALSMLEQLTDVGILESLVVDAATAGSLTEFLSSLHAAAKNQQTS